jgi:hypothetical protein
LKFKKAGAATCTNRKRRAVFLGGRLLPFGGGRLFCNVLEMKMLRRAGLLRFSEGHQEMEVCSRHLTGEF